MFQGLRLFRELGETILVFSVRRAFAGEVAGVSPIQAGHLSECLCLVCPCNGISCLNIVSVARSFTQPLCKVVFAFTLSCSSGM